MNAVEAAFRDERARVLAAVIGAFGDWDLAEEAVQEAYAAALSTWPRDGVPDHPRAWLITTARNRAIDRLRRAARSRAGAVEEAVELDLDLDALDSGITDEPLRLLYTCCHPALGLEAQVSLALRVLCGLSTAEVARLFLVPEATMAKRLVRVKRKIALAGIPYRVPPAHLLPERTTGVLNTIHLLYTRTYPGGSDGAARRLARLVTELMPEHAEAGGLYALLLLLDARRHARVSPAGALVPLEDQDRSRWDDAMIALGLRELRRCVTGRVGPFQLQAMIAGCHVQERTDWARITGLYDRLLALVPSPAVRLNRAIAVAMRDGPDQALLDGIDHPLVAATRADFLRRLGRPGEAGPWYRRALEQAALPEERAYLMSRLTAGHDGT